MSPRDWRMRIEDILSAIERVERYTSGLSYADFCSSDMVVDAVLRNMAVIGEAARHIPLEVTLSHPDVPWSRLRGIRNIVVHEYFGVDTAILWETARQDLPPLQERLRRLL